MYKQSRIPEGGIIGIEVCEGYYKDFFKVPWCPLFGALPATLNIPNTQVTRCIKIINEARRVWDVHHLYLDCYGNSDHSKTIRTLTSYPNPVDIPYPEYNLTVARAIYESAMHISQYTIIMDARTDWYEKGDGTSDTVHTLASRWEEAVEVARRAIDSWLYVMAKDGRKDFQSVYYDEGVEDYEILAILAIDDARSALWSILAYGESEEDTIVVQEVQEASDLLTKAKELYIQPDIELGRKTRKERNKGAWATQNIIQNSRSLFYEACQKEADKIWDKNYALSKEVVASRVRGRAKENKGEFNKLSYATDPEKGEYLLDKKIPGTGAIKNHIKKPPRQ